MYGRFYGHQLLIANNEYFISAFYAPDGERYRVYFDSSPSLYDVMPRPRLYDTVEGAREFIDIFMQGMKGHLKSSDLHYQDEVLWNGKW